MINIYDLTTKERDVLLSTTTHFNIHYNTYKKYKVVYDNIKNELGVSSASSKELWCVVTNVARAIAYSAKGLSIPKDRLMYSNNKQKIGYVRMFNLLDSMVEHELFVFYKGGIVEWGNGMQENKCATSVYQITNKFLDLWNGVDVSSSTCVLDDSVVIRKRGTKEELSTRRVSGVADKRKQMDLINECYLRTDVELDGVILAKQQYRRVYTNNLYSGGRLYNSVGGIQTAKKETRKMLTINGKPAVELDFKAIHLCMLYEKLWNSGKESQQEIVDWLGGEEAIKDFDPYALDPTEILEVDYNKIEEYKRDYGVDNYNPVRNLIKYALLISINTDDLRTAVGAFTLELYGEKRKWDSGVIEGTKYYGISVPDVNVTDKRFPFSALLRFVMESHAPIAKHFFDDSGITLQTLDSDIVCDVLSEMIVKEDVACFSEHDSIICPVDCAEMVEQMMREAYKRHLGSDVFCKIEKK